jgi:hypothetical protein
MKFRGNGSVWDKEKNKMLVKFGRSKLVEVEDEYIVNKLFEYGYEAEEEECLDVDYKVKDEVIEDDLDDLTKKELVVELKNQGIEVPKSWKRVKKDDLIDLFGGE